MSLETKIIIADDHPIFRRGLKQVIEEETGLRVIGDAENGIEALALIEKLSPDVAIIDGHMPEMGGLELAKTVKSKNLPVKLVFLTMFKDEAMFNEAMSIGVKGYVLKDNAVTDIVACIKSVNQGQPFIAPSLTQFLLNRSNLTGTPKKEDLILKSLTKTERRILRFIAEEKTSREIGEILFIHPRTVDNHRTNICQKLDLHGSNALLRFALTHKADFGN
jgi:DNA-binding NarL/FixJ family response regulator